MIVGIVGSRKRNCRSLVYELVDTLPKNDTECIISGGCRGVDTWSEERAKEIGIKTKIFKPDLTDMKHKGDMVSRYYARNKKIAESVDILYAFVSSDRTGGTENTIKYAKELNKKVVVM